MEEVHQAKLQCEESKSLTYLTIASSKNNHETAAGLRWICHTSEEVKVKQGLQWGKSLNDTVEPTVQEDFYSTFKRFRVLPVALSADRENVSVSGTRRNRQWFSSNHLAWQNWLTCAKNPHDESDRRHNCIIVSLDKMLNGNRHTKLLSEGPLPPKTFILRRWFPGWRQLGRRYDSCLQTFIQPAWTHEVSPPNRQSLVSTTKSKSSKSWGYISWGGQFTVINSFLEVLSTSIDHVITASKSITLMGDYNIAFFAVKR